MTQAIRILVAQDEHSTEKLAPYFDDETETQFTHDAKQILALAESWQPNIIIIDVQLSHKNAYEVADAIKQNVVIAQIPLIFYSDKDSLRERMLGYEMGAVDYFHQDHPAEEVRAKLNAIARHSQNTHALQKNAESAQKTAIEALTTSSELGKAVRYVEQSYDIAEFDDLAHLLSQFCCDLNLSSVLLFVTRSGHRFYCSNGSEVTPIEKDLIEKLHSTDRFVDFGCRTLTNFSQVSLLIKNMPINDRGHYGRIKDAIPFVLGATDAKVRMLDAEIALTAHCASLTSSVEAAQLTLDTVHDDFKRNEDIVSSIMGELSSTMEMDIEKMNMDESDEQRILELIESTSRKLHIILQENNQTDTILKNLIDLLEKLTQEESKIIVDALSKKPDESIDYQTDIELF